MEHFENLKYNSRLRFVVHNLHENKIQNFRFFYGIFLFVSAFDTCKCFKIYHQSSLNHFSNAFSNKNRILFILSTTSHQQIQKIEPFKTKTH